MIFGLKKEGFKRKLYTDIEEDLFTRARDLFGEDINLTERSPLGIFLRVIAWSLALIWQVAENTYHQSHLPSAEGINLDYICEKADIYRFPALKSIGEVTITGKPDKKIYRGFKVMTADKIMFKTLKEVKIGNDGKVKVQVEAVKLGDIGNVQATAIDTIVNPEVGIDSVTNEKRFFLGREIETDDELRNRYKLSFRASGKATIDAIITHLLKIPTLKGLKVMENNTMEIVNDMEPKSIKVIVLGGTDEEVGTAIFDSKAAGISTNGNISYMATDNLGKQHEMKFSRATELPIFANIKVKFTDDSVNTEKLINEIKERFKQYIKKVQMGESVILARAISTILCSHEEIKDLEMRIGKDTENLKEENIELLDEEVATTRDENIEIVVMP